MARFCTHCGYPVDEHNQFCGRCGSLLFMPETPENPDGSEQRGQALGPVPSLESQSDGENPTGVVKDPGSVDSHGPHALPRGRSRFWLIFAASCLLVALLVGLGIVFSRNSESAERSNPGSASPQTAELETGTDPSQSTSQVSANTADTTTTTASDANSTSIADDGLIWKFQAGDERLFSPTVADGIVYCGSADSYVYAVDAITGKEIWRFKTGFMVTCTPCIFDGIVYFGSSDSNVYAVGAKSGEEIWRYDTGNIIMATPTIANDVLYIGSADSYLYALDAKRGTLVWRFKTDGMALASAVVENGVVFFGGTDSYLHAVDAESGREKWRFQGLHPEVSYVTVYDGVVYCRCRDYIFELDALSGDLKGGIACGGNGPMVLSDEEAYFCGEGIMFATDKKNGWELWRLPTTSAWYPVVSGGLVYFADGDSVRAVNRQTGEEVWRFSAGNITVSGPVISNGIVYFSGSDGALYAVAAPADPPLLDIATETTKGREVSVDDDGRRIPSIADFEGKYMGIVQVIATGWETGPDYDPDNKTGYATGQWIDIRVVSGKCREYDGFVEVGDIRRGIQSYGGDWMIVGKPQVGDYVGFYIEGYSKVWEKIEWE